MTKILTLDLFLILAHCTKRIAVNWTKIFNFSLCSLKQRTEAYYGIKQGRTFYALCLLIHKSSWKLLSSGNFGTSILGIFKWNNELISGFAFGSQLLGNTTGCHADLYTVNRCRTRGESQEFIARRWQRMQARDPPWLWNPGETSSEVQNRGISGATKSTKRTHVLQKCFKKKEIRHVCMTVCHKMSITYDIATSVVWKREICQCVIILKYENSTTHCSI